MSEIESQHRAKSVFERHRKKVLALLLPMVVLGSDLSLTAILRWTGVYVPASRRESELRCPHPVFHHGLRPSVAIPGGGAWGEQSYDVFSNSLGFKDGSTRTVSMQADNRRVLLIGDSFTEGIGIEYPETFAGRLDAAFAEEGVEVLNAGVASYSPLIYARKCRHLLDAGLQIDRLVVCLDLSDIHDEVELYGERDGRIYLRGRGFDETLKDLVRDHTILLSALRGMVRNARAQTTERNRALDLERSSWTRIPELWERFGHRGLAAAERHMDALQADLSSRGIPMSLVVYPWPDQIVHRERDCVQVTHWRDWAQRNGVEFINLFPLFLDAGQPDEVIASYFIDGDVHWNAAGHDMVAKSLVEQLSR